MRLAALALSAVFLAVATSACGGRGDELTVFASISLGRPLEEAAAVFEAEHPDADLSFNFAGSQLLRFQLVQGARADVFVSADERQMRLVREERLVAGEPQDFARNRLAVVVPDGNPAGLRTLDDLASSGLRLVWADQGVPLGAYSREALAALAGQYGDDFPQRVEANVVSQEANAEAVVGKVELREADAAFVYLTDARRLEQTGATVIAIPDAAQPDIRYLAAPLSEAGHPDLARAFVEFLLTERAQRILIDHGFLGVR